MTAPEIHLAEIAPGLWGMPPRVSASPRVFKRKPTEAEKQAFLDSLGPPIAPPPDTGFWDFRGWCCKIVWGSDPSARFR